MGIKRFFWCFLFGSLVFPGLVFSGGSAAPSSSPSPAAAQSSAEPESAEAAVSQETVIQDPVVASVQLTRPEPIYLKELQSEIVQMEKQTGAALTPEQRQQVLDVMINQRLALQAAARDGIKVTDGELEQQFQALRDTVRQALGRDPTDEEFTTIVKNETGMDVRTYRDTLRRQLLMQRYLVSKKKALIETVREPTDKDVADYYSNNREKFIRAEGVRLGIIHIPAQNEALANRLIREIGSSAAKFDEKVEESRAPNSGYEARVGFFERNQQNRQIYGQALVDSIFSLEQGKVSQLIKNSQGFFILKVTNNYPFKTLGLSDEIQPETGRLLKEYILALLRQEYQLAAYARAEQELVSELRSITPVPYQVFKQNLPQ